MISCLKLAMLLLVADTALGCKYFCKNPDSGQYVCCDEGNPFPQTDVDEEQPSSNPETVTYPPGESANCYYYCGWDDNVYCCHEASSPLSPQRDHSNHRGSCPDPAQMVCVAPKVYEEIKNQPESIFLKNGSVVVPDPTDKYDVCASDGYCLEDERCCANPCAQRHTCVKALPGGGDQAIEFPEKPDGDSGFREGESTGCYYNCVYHDQIYCCHEVGSPYTPNRNHSEHKGTCPTEDQMSCMEPEDYDLIKDDPRQVILANGTVFVSYPRDKYDMCASDGYCSDDEKCCANPCAKRYSCVKALEEDKSELEKETFVKKKVIKGSGKKTE